MSRKHRVKQHPFEWERWLKKRVQGNRRFFLTNGFLHLVSYFYRGVVTLRHWGYDWGVLKTKHSSLPVVSVGALVCGGTKKTPLTAHIAQTIGEPVGILTSGYAAKIRDGGKKVTTPLQGDEPFLLSLKVPYAKVYAHPKRIKSVRALEKESVAYLLMDSGLQHRALHRELEIVTVDAKNPFAHGHFIPRGFLKDLPSRLRAADWVIIMDSEDELHFENLVNDLKKIHPYGKFIGMKGAFAKPELIRDKTVGMFCGIACPEGFEKMLKREGCQIVTKKILSDHEPFEDPTQFVKECREKGAEFVVCTEKDFVKLSDKESIVPLEFVVEVAYNEKEYQKMISAIKILTKKG